MKKEFNLEETLKRKLDNIDITISTLKNLYLKRNKGEENPLEFIELILEDIEEEKRALKKSLGNIIAKRSRLELEILFKRDPAIIFKYFKIYFYNFDTNQELAVTDIEEIKNILKNNITERDGNPLRIVKLNK